MNIRSSLRRVLAASLCLAAIAWLAGLLLFVEQIKALSEPPVDDSLQPTDAIVALTGGSERIPVALELLRAGKGKKLFVSGVHPGLTLDRLLSNQPLAPELRQCCVILGHAAESTLGNAMETRLWLAAEDFHTLRLVTANYHMPRSLMIFRAELPEIEIIPHPVAPDSVKLDEWWARPRTINLLVNEYDKYIWALLRPHVLPEPVAP